MGVGATREEGASPTPGVAYTEEKQSDSALDEIDRLLGRLNDEINELAAQLHPVSRFDVPVSDISEVRSEPGNVLRGFAARLEDSITSVRRIRRQLDF